MTWDQFAAKAMSVPFVPLGRGYSGWDCWGLVMCGYRDVLGIELPTYEGNMATRGMCGLSAVCSLMGGKRHGSASGEGKGRLRPYCALDAPCIADLPLAGGIYCIHRKASERRLSRTAGSVWMDTGYRHD